MIVNVREEMLISFASLNRNCKLTVSKSSCLSFVVDLRNAVYGFYLADRRLSLSQLSTLQAAQVTFA